MPSDFTKYRPPEGASLRLLWVPAAFACDQSQSRLNPPVLLLLVPNFQPHKIAFLSSGFPSEAAAR